MLRLAENKPANARSVMDYYIPVPHPQTGKPVLVREDALDNLSDKEWHAYMDLLEREGLGSRADRRAERQARRHARTEKRQAKADKKLAKVDLIKAKTEALKGVTAPLSTDAAGSGAGMKTGAPGKSKTFMYVGIGAAALLVIFIATKKKKPGRRK